MASSFSFCDQNCELAVGKHILGLRKGRNPAPVLESRVPADVVTVKVRAHDVVDVADTETGGS